MRTTLIQTLLRWWQSCYANWGGSMV